MPGGLLDLFGIDPIANRQKKERLMLQELQNKGQLDVQNLQNRGQLDVEGKRGEETRKTRAQDTEQQKMLETLKSSNAISEAAKRQIMEIMAKEGVVYSPENEKVFDKSLTDTRIRKALQADTQMVNARNAPGFADTLAQGMQAQNLAPAFANQKAGTVSASPGELVAQPPSGAAMPPGDLNQWNVMQGAQQNQTVEEVSSPIPGMPPQVKVINQQTPGRIRISPQLLQRAATITPQQPQALPAPTVDEIVRGMGIVPANY